MSTDTGSDLSTLLAQAMQQQQAGHWRDTEALCRRVLLEDADNPDALHMLGLVAYQHGDYDESVRLVGLALKKVPAFAEAQANLGSALQAQGRLDAAIRAFQQAIALNPAMAVAHYNLGNALRAQGRLQDAVDSYLHALRNAPGHVDAHNNLGEVQQAQGRHELAIASYRRALSLQPGHADAGINLGNALQEQGDFAGAEQCYRQTLDLHPDLAIAHNNLGNALMALGRREDAVKAYTRAVTLKSDYLQALINLGNALLTQGRPKLAVERYKQALAIAPQHAQAHNNLGSALQAQGKSEAAIARYWQALLHDPDLVEAHYNLGLALGNSGKADSAIACYRRAIALRPGHVDAHNNLGNLLADAGQLEEALACFQRAIALKPDYAEARLNLGNALQALGRNEDAAASYREALAIRPDFVAAQDNLGNALQALGRHTEAVECHRRAIRLDNRCANAFFNLGNAQAALGDAGKAMARYRDAIALQPSLAEAHNNLGNLLRDAGQQAEAVAAYRDAVAQRPGYAEAWCNLGSALRAQGDYPGAMDGYGRAIALNAGFAKAHYNLGHVLQLLGRLGEAGASYRRALAAQPDYPEAWSSLLFTALHDPKLEIGQVLDEHLRYAEQFEAPLRASWPVHGNDRDPERPLRIGFVSGDLFQHPVALFIARVWETMDRHRFALHVYSQQVHSDRFSEHLQSLATRWTDVRALDDAALAARIRADAIDILVDLSGHTAHNRLGTFARKPAPVQASWIGYPGTTGLRAMDYYLFNGYCAPPGLLEDQFVEELVRLPAPAPLLPPDDSPDVSPLPALARGHVTFGSFNRASKLGEQTVALWAAALKAVPDSRLWLGHLDDEGLYRDLRTRFEALGVSAGRLEFRGHLPLRDYLAAHADIDIALDSFPYTGGATSRYALWMGVPVLSLVGPGLPQRQGLGLNAAIGLEDWAVPDAASFVEKAQEASADLQALARLRAGMRDRLAASPLMHPELLARGLEQAFRRMWRRWCAGLAPTAFDVNAQDVAMHDVREHARRG